MRKQGKKLILARETILNLSNLDRVKGATRGTALCTLITQLPVGCSDYCPTTPVTTLGYTCAE